MGTRLSWGRGFGHRKPSGGGAGPMMRIVRGGESDMPPDGGPVSAPDRRVSLEVYAAASNLTNHVNDLGYVGVMTSPFFGRPTSARPGA